MTNTKKKDIYIRLVEAQRQEEDRTLKLAAAKPQYNTT